MAFSQDYIGNTALCGSHRPLRTPPTAHSPGELKQLQLYDEDTNTRLNSEAQTQKPPKLTKHTTEARMQKPPKLPII